MKQKNRPDLKDDRPKGVLFSTEGSTGWGRKRDLGDYKGGVLSATSTTSTTASPTTREMMHRERRAARG
jgi:hypothetical protein